MSRLSRARFPIASIFKLQIERLPQQGTVLHIFSNTKVSLGCLESLAGVSHVEKVREC